MGETTDSEATTDVAGQTWTATGLEPQVFLDRSGRRRRLVGVAGTLAVVVCGTWLGGILGASAGFASLPALRSAPFVAHAPAHHPAHRGHLRHRHVHEIEVAAITRSHD